MIQRAASFKNAGKKLSGKSHIYSQKHGHYDECQNSLVRKICGILV